MTIQERANKFHWGAIGSVGYLSTFWIPANWDVSLIVLGSSGMLAVLFGRRRSTLRQIPLLPESALFVAAVVLATLLSRNVIISLSFGAAFLPAVLVFYLIAVDFREPRHVRAVYAALSASALALSVGLLATAWQIPGGDRTVWTEAFAIPLLVVPNDVIFLALISPLSLALLANDEPPVLRLIAAASLVVSLAVIIVLASRGALLAYMIGGALMASSYRPRHALAALTALVIMFVLVDGFRGFAMFERLTSVGYRPSLWLAAVNMFFDRPALGFGPHTFGLFYDTQLARGELPVWLSASSIFTPWPHNLYLEVAAEQGLIGFACLLILLARGVVGSLRARAHLDGPLMNYVSACMASLVAFAMAGVYELTFLRIWVVILPFVLIGVASRLERAASSKAPE